MTPADDGPQAQAPERIDLAEGFAVPSVADWEQLARAKDADATLTTAVEDDAQVAWLYTRADARAPDPGGRPGADPFVRGVRGPAPWAIRQTCEAPDRRRANDELLADLEGGATEVLLGLRPGRGVPVDTVDELDEVLAGVLLDLAPVALDAGAQAPAKAELLCELWRRRGHPGEEVGGALRVDPIGALAAGELSDGELGDAFSAAFSLAARVHGEFPRVRSLAVDTGVWADGGAGAVDELALALAAGIALLRAGADAGWTADAVAACTEFTLIAGPDQFLEIAKLRAARRLWAFVLAQSGVAPPRRRSALYVRTSRRMVSSLDPWVNILRATSAAFAAATGGADGITVLGFDEPYAETVTEPGPLGRRVARNTQLLLQEESALHRVADPAGGSWYVESLTDQLARRAWEVLRETERACGIAAALGSGWVSQRLAAATAARHDAIARRRRELTGVNTFPLLGDDGLERPAPDSESAADAAIARDAAAFEHLRARSGALDDADDERAHPAIYLACLGPLSAHVSVNLWARSFFEAGGLHAHSSGVVADAADHGERLSELGLRIAAVCAGPKASAEERAEVVRALRDAGAERILLAQAPDDDAEAAGADLAVRDGVDMVTVLGELLDLFDAELAR